jgi:DedD protein
MAFFKLRFPGQSASTGADALSNTPAESVEVIRKRARHRLMGSVILVLGAVVGLPLLFDSQPRPVAIDTPIVIPDRNQVAPLASPASKSVGKERPLPAIPEQVAVNEVPNATKVPEPKSVKGDVANVAALDPHEEVVHKDGKSESKSDAKADAKPDPKPDVKLDHKAEAKSEHKTDKKPDPKAEVKGGGKEASKDAAKDAAKVKALLDGKDASASSEATRSVVQVGAYADLAKAKEARNKLEQAGIKTYTQEVETKEGKRIRVRVGPFASKEEADKAAEKIRKLNLPTTVLKL